MQINILEGDEYISLYSYIKNIMDMSDIRNQTTGTLLTGETEDMDTVDNPETGDNLERGLELPVTPAITRSNSKSGPPQNEP